MSGRLLMWPGRLVTSLRPDGASIPIRRPARHLFDPLREGPRQIIEVLVEAETADDLRAAQAEHDVEALHLQLAVVRAQPEDGRAGLLEGADDEIDKLFGD